MDKRGDIPPSYNQMPASDSVGGPGPGWGDSPPPQPAPPGYQQPSNAGAFDGVPISGYSIGAPYGQPPQNYTNNVVMVGSQNVYGNMPPKDYMGMALIATLLCFFPVGIFAILKASESRSALARGDLQQAHEAANSARTLSIASIVTGSVVLGILVIVLAVVLSRTDYWYYN